MSSNPQFTLTEIENMRRVIRQHDAAQQKDNVFDLSKPPAKAYVFQEFPRLVYAADYDHFHHGNPETKPHEREGKTLLVKDQKELDAAIKKGFLLDPPAPEPDEEVEASAPKPKKSGKAKKAEPEPDEPKQ